MQVAEQPASEQNSVQATQILVQDTQIHAQDTPVTVEVTQDDQDSGVQLKRDLLQVVADHEEAARLKNMNE